MDLEPSTDADSGDRQAPGGLDLARLATTEAALAQVEHALARLDAGTWGTCETCGAAIDGTKLDDDPTARSCAAHH